MSMSGLILLASALTLSFATTMVILKGINVFRFLARGEVRLAFAQLYLALGDAFATIGSGFLLGALSTASVGALAAGIVGTATHFTIMNPAFSARALDVLGHTWINRVIYGSPSPQLT